MRSKRSNSVCIDSPTQYGLCNLEPELRSSPRSSIRLTQPVRRTPKHDSVQFRSSHSAGRQNATVSVGSTCKRGGLHLPESKQNPPPFQRKSMSRQVRLTAPAVQAGVPLAIPSQCATDPQNPPLREVRPNMDADSRRRFARIHPSNKKAAILRPRGIAAHARAARRSASAIGSGSPGSYPSPSWKPDLAFICATSLADSAHTRKANSGRPNRDGFH